MATRKIIVTGLPNEAGAILEGHDLIAALDVAAKAKAAGLEGRIYLVGDDDKVVEFNVTTKAKGSVLAKAPWTP